MPMLKASEIRKMKDEEIQEKLSELRAELAKLKAGSARGTLRKETGKVKAVRRTIARLLTVLNERRLGS